MMVVVTGGASSGKSAFAEQVATSLSEPFVYLATMQSGGAEATARIKRHRALRAGKGFATVECPHALEDAAAQLQDERPTVLLEDLGNLAANEFFGPDSRSADQVMEGIRIWAQRSANLVIVTNEIGSDGIAYDDEIIGYLGFLGNLSCACAAMADAVAEVAAGIPRILKGAEVLAPVLVAEAPTRQAEPDASATEEAVS